MGVYLELIDHNQLFIANASRSLTIVNDLVGSSKSDKENFDAMIYTTYKSDFLSNLPTCECGEIAGEYNIGVVCSSCGTEVRSPLEQDLQPLVWMRAPKGVKALMSPTVWTMLKEKFTKNRFEIIRWLCDTGYKPTNLKTPPILDEVMALEIPRGFNYFHDHFDEIIEKLFKLKSIPKPKKGQLDPLQELLKTQRNCIFSQYLPLPNRSLLVIEETKVGIYRDPMVTGAVDAIKNMEGIDSILSPHTTRIKENRTVKTIAQLAEFYDGMSRNTLAGKPGIFRKHVFGTRSHFSFRAVISSLTNNHSYDELHIPWGIGISVFEIHLTNKLFRRGYTPNAAKAFLNAHAQRHHKLLEELFKQLINECPYVGIPVVFQRNPSLERGSAQAMFVTRVKPDPSDPTVGLSILSVTGFNADFDGRHDCRRVLNLSNCWKLLRAFFTTTQIERSIVTV